MTPACRRSYYRSVTPRWTTYLTSLHYGKTQTPPRSPWARNHPKTYNVVIQNKKPHLPAKFPAMMTTDVQTISMRSEYLTTKKRVSPNGTTNTVITAHRLGKVHLTNAVDAEPRVSECKLFLHVSKSQYFFQFENSNLLNLRNLQEQGLFSAGQVMSALFSLFLCFR